MHIFATSPSLMTKFATSATEFGKKSNHISGAVERKHFITGRITIYIPTICICKGWKEICRGIFLFLGLILCICSVQKQHKKDENSRGKERFPDISLFIQAYAYRRCIDSFISQENRRKIRKNISENVAKIMKKNEKCPKKIDLSSFILHLSSLTFNDTQYF